MRSYWDPRLLGSSRAGPGLGEAAEEPDNEINLATGGSEDPAAWYDAAGGGDGRGAAGAGGRSGCISGVWLPCASEPEEPA